MTPWPVRTLAWVACVLALFLIMYGAFVRLSNAGLSCPDWPTCYGRITWPVAPAAIAKADKAFPERPVEVHRAWREQTHRFAAATLGLLVLAEALVATFARKRRFGLVIAAIVLIGIGIPLYMRGAYVASSIIAAIGEALLLAMVVFWRHADWRRIAVLALAVVCFQALLGMWTVTWLLKPIVVTGHLLGGMATFGLLAWLAWYLSLNKRDRKRWGQVHFSTASAGRFARLPKNEPDPISPKNETAPASPRWRKGLLIATTIGVVVLAGQLFLGGWTSANYAALACGTGGSAFPTCLGQWWPTMNFHQGFILWRGIGVDYQGGILDAAARTAIQMVHRFGAVVVFVYLMWLAHRAGRAGLRWHGAALALLLVAQVLLGIGNVTLGLPLWVAVAHTGGAALLLFVLMSLLVQSVSMRSVSVRSSMIAASPDPSVSGAAPSWTDQNGLPWPDFPRSRAVIPDRRESESMRRSGGSSNEKPERPSVS